MKSKLLKNLLGGVKIFTITALLASCTEDDSRKLIVCWGDSLTAPGFSKELWKQTVKDILRPVHDFDISYPNQMAGMLPDSFRIVNCGVGGETTLGIMARQGAAPMLLAHDVTVLQENTVVFGNADFPPFVSSWDSVSVLHPLVQSDVDWGGSHVNPAQIAGHTVDIRSHGNLYKNSADEWRCTYTYEMTLDGKRTIDSEDTLPALAPVTTQAMRDYRKAWCNVIFMGQNGGWRDAADLIAQFKAMIAYSECPRYVIVSHHAPRDVNRLMEVEDSLQMAFGDRYINLRRTLVDEGLQRAGLTATPTDRDSMAHHRVPPQLLQDGCHFTKQGYNVLAQLVSERIKALYLK